MLDFAVLAQQCAPTVAVQTMAAVVHTESTFNPYAIGVVGGRLARQPRALDEAVATAKALEAAGWNFSVGIAQVNLHNLPKYQLSYEEAFDPCKNLWAGSKILEDCYTRASARMPGQDQAALRAAFSCYYSGNFTRGFRSDTAGKPSYVTQVVANADLPAKPIAVVPAISTNKPSPAAAKPSAASDPAPLAGGVSAPGAAAGAETPPADHAPVWMDFTVAREPAGAPAPPAATPATPETPVMSSDGAGDGPVKVKVVDQPAAPAAAPSRDSIIF